tara:strand:+ start:190 stop:945 length:756 start_codon:yes stop_codon:yes gene_type:complete
MKISYAITVVDEFVEIQRLVTVLLENKRLEDEIVILFDSSREDLYVEEYLRAKSVNGAFSWHKGTFEGHFADWKNKLSSFCSGDYIFQIDADELPHKSLITSLPAILQSNPDNEVYLVPRVNTVVGLTEAHIQKWGWKVNDKQWVNWPDYQWRIWKNTQDIKWINKVHEKLDGYKKFGPLPDQEELSLYHPKDIERQEKQNNFYDNLLNVDNHFSSKELKEFYQGPTNKLVNLILPLINLIFIFNETCKNI